MNKKTSLLQVTSVQKILTTTLLALFSEGIYLMTTTAYIQEETQSPLLIGYMFVAMLLPSLILAPILGVLLDLTSRRKMGLICLGFRSLSILGLVVLVSLKAPNLVLIYIFMFINSTFSNILVPILESISQSSVTKENYNQMSSLLQGAWQIGLLLSGITMGLAMYYFGTAVSLGVALAANILAFVSLSLNKEDPYVCPPPKSGKETFLQEIENGYKVLLGNRRLFYFAMALSCVLPFLEGLNVLMAPLNYQVLQGNDITFGFLDAIVGVGSAISAYLCTFFGKEGDILKNLVRAPLFLIVTTLFLGFCNNILMALMSQMAIGFFVGHLRVLSRTMVYHHSEERYIGRIMMTINAMSWIIGIIFTFGVGYAAQIKISYGYYLLGLLLLFPVYAVILGRQTIRDENRKKGHVGVPPI